MYNQIKNRINQLLKNKDYSPIIENFASLSTLQIVGYILPLITLPYLVRVLGPEKYGLIAFATAFVVYFQILTNYGFNLSATRDISINRDNNKKLSEIFSSVMFIKVMLAVLSFIILSIIVYIIPQFKINWQIYYLSFGGIIGNMLLPTFFFQGMEKMKFITILNVLSQVIFTISIFVFINNISDYLYVPLISSLGLIIAGILGLIVLYIEFDIKFKLPTFKSLKKQLIQGWHVFISLMATSLYTASNVFILGLLTNNTYVGYYAISEKIILAVVGLLSPISQAIYPYISRTVNKSKEKGLEFIRKITLIMGALGFILSILIFIFAGLIIEILAGSQYTQSIIVLQILAFLPLVVGLSNVFGIQTMLTLNYKKAFSRIIITAGVFNIVLALLLVPFYKQIGISVSFLITETLITVSMYLYLKHKGINLIMLKDLKEVLKI